MIRANVRAMVCLTVASVLLGLLCGCATAGSSPPAAGETVISAVEAIGSATQIAQTFNSAVRSMNAGSCSMNKLQYFCLQPIATTAACTGGGTASITGNFSAYWSPYASGPASSTFVYTPTNCAIAGSSLLITGSPSLSVSGIVTFFYSTPTALSLLESGTVAYGPKPSGVCQANLTVNATFGSPTTCTVTGTMCGQSINTGC